VANHLLRRRPAGLGKGAIGEQQGRLADRQISLLNESG
jgi:hypothetical protein